jgi:outer membrane lipoprotein-sorting protein
MATEQRYLRWFFALLATPLMAASAFAQSPGETAAPTHGRSSSVKDKSNRAQTSPAAAATDAPPSASTPPSAAQSQPSDAGVLLRAFASMPGLEARFAEEKHIALLAKPLVSSGRLYFARPGLLLRQVETPRASQVIITPDELRMHDADGDQIIDLRARKDVQPFIASLTWLFAGDRAALEGVYLLRFDRASGSEPWRLTLTPKAGPIARLIQYIRVIGSGLAVARVEVRETSGDETVTKILDANPARHFSSAELQHMFGAAYEHGGHS